MIKWLKILAFDYLFITAKISIIAGFTKSLIGFIGDLQGNEVIDWRLLGGFTFFAVVGIFIGILLSKRMPSAGLKKGFGWFVLVMGIYIVLKETLFK